MLVNRHRLLCNVDALLRADRVAQLAADARLHAHLAGDAAGLAFGSVFAVLGWNAFVLAASALGFYAIMLL